MKRKIRLVFVQSMWDGALTGWQEIETIDADVDLPLSEGGVNNDDWHLIGGEWLEGGRER